MAPTTPSLLLLTPRLACRHQVKEAKAFSLQVEKLRKATAAGSRKEAALSYAAALEALEIYLNDVEV